MSKQLSSVDANYNNLTNNQKASYQESYHFFDVYSMKPGPNQKKTFTDTDTYLKEIERKFQQKKAEKQTQPTRRKIQDSSSEYDSAKSSDSDGFKRTASKLDQMPAKFQQISSKKDNQIYQSKPMSSAYNAQSRIQEAPVRTLNEPKIVSEEKNHYYQQPQIQYPLNQSYQAQQINQSQNIQYEQPLHMDYQNYAPPQQNLQPPAYHSRSVKNEFQHIQQQQQNQSQNWQILDQMSQKYNSNHNSQVLDFRPQFEVEKSAEQSRITNPNNQSVIKAQFFDIATHLKDQLPLNHPGKQMLTAQLYIQATKQNIPQLQWTAWIQQKLNEG